MNGLDLLAHHRLCARHASEWIPDENDLVCIFVESLVCDGDLVEYVPRQQLDGAVEALREIVHRAEKPCGAHEVPLPYDVAWAEQVAIAKAALDQLGGHS
jgi:hypothetical protein